MALETGNMFDGVAGIGGQIASTLGSAFPYLIVLVIGVIAGVYFYFESKYNKSLLLLKISGPGFRIINDKAKLFKDKDGVSFWRTKKTKLLLDVPPSECVLPGGKGDFVIGYVNSLGEVQWTLPSYNPHQILEKLKFKKEGQDVKLNEFEQKVFDDFLKDFKPVTTTQRASYAYQQSQARSELKLDFLKQNFPLIIGGAFLLIMMIIVFMFWGKIMDPLIQAEEKLIAHEERMESMRLQEIQILGEVYGVVQHIQSSLNITNEAKLPPQIPQIR